MMTIRLQKAFYLMPLLIVVGLFARLPASFAGAAEATSKPVLLKGVAVPDRFLAKSQYGLFGGDIRIGDLTGDGRMDLLVYRSVDGVKPCFIGAFTLEGEILWQRGGMGDQPIRPGPVAIHDIDGDGNSEVICFFHDPTVSCPPESLQDVVVQILDGATGNMERSVHPQEFDVIHGEGPNWVHQRLLVANLRGSPNPRDFIVKLGSSILAFNHRLEVIWRHTNSWVEYSRCPAYIPCVGDIDGDGKDEINGGYFLLDDDGAPFWEKQLGRHMDSVAISEWDNGQVRAFCSGYGHVMDCHGNEILRLGEHNVPHGQELRVGRFDASKPGMQMMIRYNGHTPDVLLVGQMGEVLRRFRVNESPNNTGMETIWWQGPSETALLYNGGSLWRGDGNKYSDLPGLPPVRGDARQGWYHCIPVDVSESPGEEILVYNPWDRHVFLFSKGDQKGRRMKRFNAGPRQYNVRLMD